jgi:hypothetical protein
MGTSTNATSTFDQIDEFANPVSQSIDIGTPVEIDLNANTSEDTVRLESPAVMVSLPAGATASGTTAYAPPQTFSSEDLADSFPSANSAQASFTARILGVLRRVLAYALNYLRPFGGIPANQYVD